MTTLFNYLAPCVKGLQQGFLICKIKRLSLIISNIPLSLSTKLSLLLTILFFHPYFVSRQKQSYHQNVTHFPHK